MNIKQCFSKLFVGSFLLFASIAICLADNPKVSIIVPVYKVEPYIKKCMDSLVNQTLKDIEIICIDDKSPDNCGQILEEYKAKDSRVKVVHQSENRGVSAARNVGIDNSTGEYISFVDSDDYVDQKTYEIAYKCAKDDNIDILQFGFRKFNDGQDDGNNTNKNFSKSKVLNLEQFLKKRNLFAWSKLFKSDVIKRNNIKFDENIPLAEDTCFSYSVFPEAERFKIIPVKFYNYRIRKGSAVRTWNHDKYNNKYMLDIIHSIYNSWEKRKIIKGKEHILLTAIVGVVKKKVTKFDYTDEILDLTDKLNSPQVLGKCPSWVEEEIQNIRCASQYNKMNYIKDGIYRIECASNKDMALDISNASRKNGAELQIWDSNKTKAQKFEIKRVKNYYCISPLCSRKLLDVKDGNQSPGAELQQWGTNANIGKKQFYIIPCDHGTFKIISRANFLALDSGKCSKGSKVLCQKDNGRVFQKFRFIQI